MATIRKPVNKMRSVEKFKKNVSKTKAANIPTRRIIQRGGQRM